MKTNVEKTVFMFVIKNEEILLVERKDTWFENGKLTPPGGLVDDGESPQTAAARELSEETGLKIKVSDIEYIRPSYISTHESRTFENHYFVTNKFTGDLRNLEPDRHVKVDWFNLSDLPANTSDIVTETLKYFYV